MATANKLTAGAIWQTLSAIDCSEHTETKGNLTYLSWAWAYSMLMEHYPEARYEFGPHETFADQTVMVHCFVTIADMTKTMWLPVMDNRNKPIANPNSFQINTAMMRALTKCISMWGLGAYIYAGEDLPRAEQDRLDSPLNDEQAKIIGDLLAETNTDVKKFAAVYKAPTWFDLKQSNFESAKALLERKLAQQQEKTDAGN